MTCEMRCGVLIKLQPGQLSFRMIANPFSVPVCCCQPIYMKSRLSRALLPTHLNYVLPTHLPKIGLATASHAQTQPSRLNSIIFLILENNNMIYNSKSRKTTKFCSAFKKKDIKYTDLPLYLQVESS